MRPIVFTLLPQSMLAPKRARTAAAAAGSSSSSQPANAAATKLTLYGGVPHHPSLAGLCDNLLKTERPCASATPAGNP